MNIAISELPSHPVPKVSVCVITFNHEPFIAQALDGILMQETDFPFEVIVGEDCSTDRTREIVREYQRQHPNRIRTVLPDHNMGARGKRILAETLKLCRGSFVASMDGDDYWTSPNKLQKQVRLLEQNSGYSMCFHDADVIYDDESSEPHRFVSRNPQPFYEVDDLFAGTFIPSCSPLFRVHAILPLPTWYFELPSADWSHYVLAGSKGKIGYIEEVMGVYRVHQGGMWSGLDPIGQLENVVEKFVTLSLLAPEFHSSKVKWALSDTYLRIAIEYANIKNFGNAQKYAIMALRKNPLARRLDRSMMFRFIIMPYASKLVSYIGK